MDPHEKILNYLYYMTEHNWPLRKNYYTEFELKRIQYNGNFLKNDWKNFKIDKIIIGGLVLVWMIILDLIFKKEFDDDSKINYSIPV